MREQYGNIKSCKAVCITLASMSQEEHIIGALATHELSPPPVHVTKYDVLMLSSEYLPSKYLSHLTPDPLLSYMCQEILKTWSVFSTHIGHVRCGHPSLQSCVVGRQTIMWAMANQSPSFIHLLYEVRTPLSRIRTRLLFPHRVTRLIARQPTKYVMVYRQPAMTLCFL